MTRKSEWIGVCSSTERDKKALRSWFNGMIDDCEIISAQCLTEIETDREKKLRLKIRLPTGVEKLVERTFGARQFTIHFKPVAP